jgi:ribokinase
MRPARLCVVGSCNLDLTFRVAHLPRPGETVPATSLQQGYGGKGANQAVAAALLGAQVAMIGRVGDDAFGRQSLDNFQARGVDVTFVQADASRPTGLASIAVSHGGENCILVAAGANAAVTSKDVRAAAAVIAQADAVLCQLETPVVAALEAFRIARAAGVRTILNPAPALALPAELLQLTDLCVPNETELEALAGAGGDVASAARSLQVRGPRVVVVTLGAAGALVLDGAAEIVSPYRVAAVDPTGAGDVFIAALGIGLAEGRALRDAVRWANAAAAISVTRPGTQTAAPARAEVEQFLSEPRPSGNATA